MSDFHLTVYSSFIVGGSTAFGLGDLTGWVLTVDGSGTVAGIEDLNFFAENAAGYQVYAAHPFILSVADSRGDFGQTELTGITGAVPEPAPALLLGGGLVVLGWLRRRSRIA